MNPIELPTTPLVRMTENKRLDVLARTQDLDQRRSVPQTSLPRRIRLGVWLVDVVMADNDGRLFGVLVEGPRKPLDLLRPQVSLCDGPLGVEQRIEQEEICPFCLQHVDQAAGDWRRCREHRGQRLREQTAPIAVAHREMDRHSSLAERVEKLGQMSVRARCRRGSVCCQVAVDDDACRTDGSSGDLGDNLAQVICHVDAARLGARILHDVRVREKCEAVRVDCSCFTRSRSHRRHADRGDGAACRNAEEPATRDGNDVNGHGVWDCGTVGLWLGGIVGPWGARYS